VIFRQFINDDLGCASYLIASRGEAAVVDPAWDIEPYLELAAAQRLRITRVLETHTHADHVSGRGRIAAATGAEVVLPSGAGATDSHLAVTGGDVVEFGDVRIDVVATPGHRPEHVAYAIADTSRSADPQLILTGDSLLVGDVGRPDLAVGDRGELDRAAHQLFDSVRRLAALPEHMEVWPGHIGGSLCCAAGTSEKPSSTIGTERRTNAALALGGDDAALAHLLERLPERPPTVERVVALNRSGLAESVAATLVALSAEDVEWLVADGARVIDGRSASAYDAVAIRGSVSLPLEQPGLGTRAAWVAGGNVPLVLVADDPIHATRLATRLAAVGLLDVRGYLAGGIAEWRAAGHETTSIEAVDVARAAMLIRADEVALVDVRDPDEHARGVVAGSLLVPWRELPARVDEVTGTNKPILVACASGRRTSVAASLLTARSDQPILRIAEGGVPDLPAHGVAVTVGV
jgi:glyoxylase-like metal-dependent hydrolase (beta-lactamase superfamily II)/rhodanese-related sulfurtransferase